MRFEFDQPNIPPPQGENSEEERIRSDINRLLTSGVSLERLAELLGAEDFLETRTVRGQKHGPVKSFKVTDFVAWVVESAKGKSYEIQLPDHMVVLPMTILPPDKREMRMGGGVGFEKPEFIPRTRYLVDLLSEMKLHYAVADGTNDENMMRGLSYKPYLLPQIGKMVLVCNEEGNATFVVHEVSGEKDWKEYLKMRKSELKQQVTAGEVSVLFYGGDSEEWKESVRELLLSDGVEPSSRQDNLEAEKSGWSAMDEILELTGRGKAWVESRIKKACGMDPSIRRTFPLRGSPYFYRSDFVEQLVSESEDLEQAPEGWLTKTALRKRCGKDYHWVERRAETFRSSHPEWFKDYENPISAQELEYLAPQIVSLIEAETGKFEIAPAEWRTTSMMVAELHTSNRRVKEILADFPGKLEEEKGVYLDQTGKPSVHYSSNVFGFVSKEFKKRKKPEGDWATLKRFAREVGHDSATVKRAAISISTSQKMPEELHLVQVNQTTRYYIGARLADELRKHFEHLEEPSNK